MMNVGFEKVLLLYNPNIYETADIIGTYVYRRGILGAEFSFSTAVGLFQSAVGFVLVVITNRIARKVNDVGLW
jgi:putative aldouronate transport system permease protein